MLETRVGKLPDDSEDAHVSLQSGWAVASPHSPSKDDEGWLRALLGNLTWGSTKAKVFTPAKVIVKETTRPQHFEVEIDAAQLRQALGELDAWLARIKAAQRRR